MARPQGPGVIPLNRVDWFHDDKPKAKRTLKNIWQRALFFSYRRDQVVAKRVFKSITIYKATNLQPKPEFVNTTVLTF